MNNTTESIVPANEDKPHRCPRCHKIPPEARADGKAVPGKTYRCADCGVEWVTPPPEPFDFPATSSLLPPVGSATMRPEPLTHTFSITVAVDPFWVEYLTRYPDIFGRQYAGYWLRGVDRHSKRGWLCWEDDEQHRQGEEPDRVEALRAWSHGGTLPQGWYCLDRAAALRAWEEGVKRWGVDWYEQTDANREDVVVQLALLGEIRYG